MAKIHRTSDIDYRIITANGGTITLDTTGADNDGSGKVVITGDVEIKGNTTEINSTVTTIQDNIIVLSYIEDVDEDGNVVDTRTGLPASLDRPYSSGIEIDRGPGAPVSRWIYDDSITWALGGDVGQGTWLATQGTGGSEQRLPLATPGIIAGGNFYVSTGNGVITVTGTSNYEFKVLNYDNGVLTPDPVDGRIVIDDDHIPNAKAVKDLIDFSTSDLSISKIQEDNSKIEVIDKNNIIQTIVEVGSTTLIKTRGTHGYQVGETVNIEGVTTSPSDTFIDALNDAPWTVTEVPTADTLAVSKNTVGGDPANYVIDSGRFVSNESKIIVSVEDNEITSFFDNRITLMDLQIIGNELSVNDGISDADLVIGSSGSGTVKIKDVLEIPSSPYDDDPSLDPTAPISGIKIYSKPPSEGDTGVFFVNETERSGELISKNRALLIGMLF